MVVSRSRALCAAVVALLASPVAATAASYCTPVACVEVAVPAPSFGEPPWSGGSGGSGMLCLYTKTKGSPPPGWGGGASLPGFDGPYVFIETWEWGQENQGQYDSQWCIPACPTVPGTAAMSAAQLLTYADAVAEADEATCGNLLTP